MQPLNWDDIDDDNYVMDEDMYRMIMQQMYAGYNGGQMEKWSGGDIQFDEQWENLHDEKIKVATFGAGCFWGTEKYFAKDFANEHPGSIIGSTVGFMNPDMN